MPNLDNIIASLTNIAKNAIAIKGLTLCQNPNIIKDPEDITQEEILSIHDNCNYMAAHLRQILNDLQELQK